MGFFGDLWNGAKNAASKVGDFVAGAAKKVGEVGAGAARIVGKVASTLQTNPVAQGLLNAASYLPVVGGYVSKFKDALPKIEAGANLVGQASNLVQKGGEAIANRDVAAVPGLLKQGGQLYKTGQITFGNSQF